MRIRFSFIFKLNAILIIAAICSAAALYESKREAKDVAVQVEQINNSITKKKDELQLLYAAWSFRSQPKNIKTLLKRHEHYFKVKPVSMVSYQAINAIPMRNADDEIIIADELGGLIRQVEEAGGNESDAYQNARDPIGKIIMQVNKQH